MGRRIRLNIPGHAHELTFSCYKNRPFLKNRRYCDLLAKSIARARVEHSFKVFAYIFMPNHVHLLLYPTLDTYDVADILQSIKQPVSRKALNEARSSMPELLSQLTTTSRTKPYRFWQAGGGYDRNIVSEEALKSSIDYIHNNPIRAGLSKVAEDWEWSSLRDWEGLGSGPIEIDLDEFLLS